MEIICKCPYCKTILVIKTVSSMEHTPLPKEELDLFKQLKDLKVIFDVGARTDIEYINLCPDSEHHLFEPNPEFAKELREKIKDKSNVIINEFGLGDKEERRGYLQGFQAFLGSGSTLENTMPDLILPIKTLDWYTREHNIKQIDFLKIDTEGHDLKVLLGVTNWFHIIKFIQYEHWGKHNNLMIKGLLSEDFDTMDVGYRNVFCMSKTLVNEEERNKLKEYIINNKLGLL